jgi:putative membrane protein
MHIGKGYSFKEVILWTRRDILTLLIINSIPTFLFYYFKWQWLLLPWLPIALLGTAVAFVSGFKNNASYDRLWEARKIWGAITNFSRTWGIMVKDYVTTQHAKQPVSEVELNKIHLQLYNRHIAWLTALRYQLRENKTWEAINLPHNKEYRNRWFRVEEQDNKIGDAIMPYLSQRDYDIVMSKSNKATQIIALQSEYLRGLLQEGLIEDFRHMELEKVLMELYNQQGASERIKNFPYPRQYASLNNWFIKIFVALIPFGMLQEFVRLGDDYVWMTIPFSALSGWIFTTLERIGETSENPFEGSANDVPITTISRNIEIDLLEMLHIDHQLKPLQAQNNILN